MRTCNSTRCARRSRATQHRLAGRRDAAARRHRSKGPCRDGRARHLRRGGGVAPGGDRDGRHRERGHVARGVSLFARGDDLRRHGRGATQHHRPPVSSISVATSDGRGGTRAPRRDRRRRTCRRDAPGRRALADLGWLEMLEAEPRDAIAIVVRGARAATNRADERRRRHRAASAPGYGARLAGCSPEFGGWEAPRVTTTATSDAPPALRPRASQTGRRSRS